MKYIKDGLFYFLFFYVVIILGLFIRQTFIVHDTMYKEINLEPNEKYETFITESRAKLANYKTRATTQEEINCLSEVEKAINISYQLMHAPVTNYKEAKEYIRTMIIEGKTQISKFSDLYNTCKFENRNKDHELKQLNVGNSVQLDKKMYETEYIYEISFPNFLGDIRTMIPAFDYTLARTEQDFRSRFIKNEIEYLSIIMEYIGDDYENR